MVNAFGIFASVCLLLLPALAAAKPGKETVVVAALDVPVPADSEQMHDFLWKQIANRPEAGNFSSASTSKWKAKYTRFAGALVAKAAEQKLDSVSLAKVLDLILAHSEGKLAYLPVAAYHAMEGDDPIWIVTVRWEYPLINNAPTQYYHIRVFAFHQKGLGQVGYVTCG